MDLNAETALIIRITKYALTHKPFELHKLYEDLDLDTLDREFVYSTLTSHAKATESPNHILVLYHQELPPGSGTYRYWYSLVPNAFYNYVDYLEIREARINARDAKQQSLLALLVAIGSLVIGTFVGLLGIVAQLLLK